MTPLQSFITDTLFRLSSLSWLGILDILLVVVVVFSLLLILRRSRAASLLRGIIILVLVLLAITIILPLPTFNWFTRIFLLVVLITTPILLQPELRRMLENLGRSAGLSRSVRQTTAETVVPRLLRTLENLSTSRTGALLVLEGQDTLQDIIDTGIPVHGRVTAELLQTIFFDKTPLHDGAIILRGDQIVAAGCMLPLTDQALHGRRRYGTRHRAAVGLSEKCDALLLVVSEETGNIAIAQGGHLHTRQEISAVRQQIQEFYTGQVQEAKGFSWRGFWSGLRSLGANGGTHSLASNTLTVFAFLALSLLFSLAAWSFVIEETNPTERPLIENVPLTLNNLPDGLVIMNKPATAVDMQIQGAADVLSTFDEENVQAMADLANLEPGLHQVPVLGNLPVNNARIIKLDPTVVNIELVRTVNITMPITVEMTDQTISSAYQILGAPLANPEAVSISGPEPLVRQVVNVQTTLAVNNATSSINEIRPLRALDADGNEVTGITLSPTQTRVDLTIARKQNAREVGVRALTEGPPPDGYWLSRLSVEPANVTLQGDTAQIVEIGSFVDTAAIDISLATGTYIEKTSLNLPEGIQAVDNEGKPVLNVTVTAEISARSGDISISRPIEIVGSRPGITVTLAPEAIDLLLTGPLPTLTEIEATPELVRVYIDSNTLEPGQRIEVTPIVAAPDGLIIQFIPPTISVTTE